MIKNRIVAATVLGLVTSISASYAADAPVPVPYEACQGYEYKVVPKNDKRGGVLCTGNCRELLVPEITLLEGNLENTSFELLARPFLQDVAQETLNTFEKSVQGYAALKRCLDQENQPGCQKKVSEFKNALKKAKQEAEDAGAIQVAIGSMGSMGNFVNSKDFVPPVIANPLMEANARARRNDIIADAVTIERHKCGTLTGPACHKQMYEGLAKFAARQGERVQEILVAEMPVLSVLSKADLINDKTLNALTNKKLSAAVNELIEAGKNQIKITKESIARGELESTTVGKDRDLVDHMIFSPMVEKVLSQHKGYCGVALGLKQRLEKRRAAAQGVIGAGALVGFFAGGYGLPLAGVSTFATTATLGAAGVGLGWGFGAVAKVEYDSAKEAAVHGVGDLETLKQKADELRLTLFLHPLDYWGAGLAGKALAAKMLGGLVKGAQKMGPASRATSGLQGVYSELSNSVKGQKQVLALADSERAYRKAFEEAARKKGATKKEAAIIASCVNAGDESKCAGAASILAKLHGEGTFAAAEPKAAQAAKDVPPGGASVAAANTADAVKQIDWDLAKSRAVRELESATDSTGKSLNVRARIAADKDYSMYRRKLIEALDEEDSAFKGLSAKEKDDITSYILYKDMKEAEKDITTTFKNADDEADFIKKKVLPKYTNLFCKLCPQYAKDMHCPLPKT